MRARENEGTGCGRAPGVRPGRYSVSAAATASLS